MRSLLNVTTILAIALPGIAAAQPSPAQLSQNHQPQTEARYQPRNELANIRLDPRRDRAYIQVPRTGRQLDYLELRAGRASFALDDVEVLFEDGTSLHTGDRGVLQPFEGRVVDLPHRTAPVTAVIAHYRSYGHRFPARLAVFGVPEHYGHRWARRARY